MSYIVSIDDNGVFRWGVVGVQTTFFDHFKNDFNDLERFGWTISCFNVSTISNQKKNLSAIKIRFSR